MKKRVPAVIRRRIAGEIDTSVRTHVRRKDPDTSRAAAASINITAQALKVLESYADGAVLMDHEAYDRAGLDTSRARSQRCSDLRAAGLIERCGRGRTPGGAAAYTCRITDEGLGYLARVSA